MRKKIIKLKKNAVYCNLHENIFVDNKFISKIGGKPFMPKSQEWFYTYNKNEDRPLCFVAQINLSEVAPYDIENMLPAQGILYFFYDYIDESKGCYPTEKNNFKVIYYDGDFFELEEKDYPKGLDEDYQIPEFAISFSNDFEVPMCEEYNEITMEKIHYDNYNDAVGKMNLDHNHDREIFKLLGYADLCQGSMLIQCEMVSKGISCGNFDYLPLKKDYEDKASDWILLFQVDIISNTDFELMIGDAGRLYYYIRKEDLMSKRFDKCWFMTQCQ